MSVGVGVGYETPSRALQEALGWAGTLSPHLCKGRCPLTPPKDEALGNPAFDRNKRGRMSESLWLSPSSGPFFSV
ncbi:hypothetical protein SAMN02745702_00190 [Desulfobaculum bizertense DSM 18034]|uniref:Uncharacterized protein n=1 Tax=Desulfobaculum bizertense DSM 18034 TaxID=1121442 RepID=A0A1T4VFC5_9BACT|nr:hypothetical protein SAMN02745702_00190 [Desulfobaculum bizertense DSM 18034]